MKTLTVDDLRALIRLIYPVRALREDLEKSLHLETFHKTGDLAVRSFLGLRDTTAQITEDPYIQSMTLDIEPEMKDRAKIAQVILASGQLLAYLEAHTGTTGLDAARGAYSVQTAPNIHIEGDFSGSGDSISELINRAIRMKLDPLEPPTPPNPPNAPRPPRPGKAPRSGRDVLLRYLRADEEDDE